MDTGTAMLLSEVIKLAIRVWMEALATSGMTDEEKQAHYEAISDVFEQFAPDNLKQVP
jgi:hypothetical protein